MVKRSSKKGQRLHREALARKRAASTEVLHHADVVVIGAGASGCMAALAAAGLFGGAPDDFFSLQEESKGFGRPSLTAGSHKPRVVLLEAQKEAAAPILATGNGRCNLSNAQLDLAQYRNARFVREVFSSPYLANQFFLEPTSTAHFESSSHHIYQGIEKLFSKLGLLLTVRPDGWMFPATYQASSVERVLEAALKRVGVCVATMRRAETLLPLEGAGGYTVAYRELFRDRIAPEPLLPEIQASQVIVATSAHEALRLLAPYELPTTPLSPILHGLLVENSVLSSVQGLRAPVSVSLLRHHKIVTSEQGEVHFLGSHLSGIPILNLSRFAKEGDMLHLNLCPALSHDELLQRLETVSVEGELTADCVSGFIAPALADALFPDPCTVDEAVRRISRTKLVVSGPWDSAHAQVSRGGIAPKALSSASLEACDLDALYVCGEAIDVDGPCGGYNLTWAWISGLLAGIAARRGL